MQKTWKTRTTTKPDNKPTNLNLLIHLRRFIYCLLPAVGPVPLVWIVFRGGTTNSDRQILSVVFLFGFCTAAKLVPEPINLCGLKNIAHV